MNTKLTFIIIALASLVPAAVHSKPFLLPLGVQKFLESASVADSRKFAEAMYAKYSDLFLQKEFKKGIPALVIEVDSQLALSTTRKKSGEDKKMVALLEELGGVVGVGAETDLAKVAQVFKMVVERIPATERYFPAVGAKDSYKVAMSPDIFLMS